MKINRITIAFMTSFLLILQIFGTPLCLANTDGGEANLTGKIYDRGVDTDHNGKFDYLEVSIEINVTAPGEYSVSIYGLIDSKYTTIWVQDHLSAQLGIGIHLLNLSLNGPTIYVSARNPAYVGQIVLYQVRYQLFSQQFYQIDSLVHTNLTRTYAYNEFDAPFNDMEAKLTIDPDGQVHLSGALNYTHMVSSTPTPGARGNVKIVTNGNLTSASANSTFTVPPEYASQFPFNSTSFSWLEEYLNGNYSMGANATVTLPESIASEFPFNVTDVSLKSVYSNDGLLRTEINASTILPEDIASQYALNTTDFEVRGEYLNNMLSGTITVHILPGFPLGDLNIDFQGNKTDLFLTGNVIVIYDIPMYPLNETTLQQMLLYLNTTIPGHGSGSLYQMTDEILDCQYLHTKMTEFSDSIVAGANVDFNASIHGDFIEALIYMTFKYLSGYVGTLPPEIHDLVYSAINVIVSSVENASFQIAYTHLSREISVKLILVDEFLNLVRDLSALVGEISLPSLYPPYPSARMPPILVRVSFSPLTITPPSPIILYSTSSNSTMQMVEPTWISGVIGLIIFLNVTLPYVENAKIELTYYSASKRFEVKAIAQAEFPEEMTQTLPEELPTELPPEILELIELLQNTTYCKLKSSKESILYENGVANFEADYVIEGNLNAQINFVKNVFLTYIDKTSPLSEELLFINETMIDISDLKVNFNYNETYAIGDLEGITISLHQEPINTTFFKLEKLFKIMKSPSEPPMKGECLKIIVEGGSNVTHATILHRPVTVPLPDETSSDMRTMVWYNQSLSSLKDLIFEIQTQSYVVTVTAQDQLGNPIPNTLVNVYWPNGTLWKTLLTDDYGLTSTFNVDYEHMPFGTYNMTATYRGISRTQSCTIDCTKIYVVSLSVNSPQIVVDIPDPTIVTPANPVIGDASQNTGAILTINQISEPVMIAVRNVTAPEGAPPPGTWEVLGNYVQIIANETTLTVNATLRIYYTLEQLNAAGLDESSLTINYWNSTLGQWVSVQGHVNTAEHYVEAVITHFSVWTIMGQPKAAPVWAQPWFLGLIVGILILIVAVAAYIAIKKRPLQQVTKK